MIALSSLKPWSDPTEEHARNQMAAQCSWSVFKEVFLFEDFPSIKFLSNFASQQNDWCAILNADIVISERLATVEKKLKQRFTAATSYRYEFIPEAGFLHANLSPTDNGLDFFCAKPDVWRRVAEKCPDDLRLGCQMWDTWLLSFFATFECETYADITPARVVFHPKHGNRKYGPTPKVPELWSWPVMSPAKIYV